VHVCTFFLQDWIDCFKVPIDASIDKAFDGNQGMTMPFRGDRGTEGQEMIIRHRGVYGGGAFRLSALQKAVTSAISYIKA
jgi:hypothetical protein